MPHTQTHTGLFEFVKGGLSCPLFRKKKKGNIGLKGNRWPPRLPILSLAALGSPAPAAAPSPPHSSSCYEPSHSFLSSDFSTEWPSLVASISSTAILLILKKHHMFLFAGGSIPKKKKKEKSHSLQTASTNRFDLVLSYLLLTAPSCPFIIVICTSTIFVS